MKTNFRIKFTKRQTMATCLSSPLVEQPGTERYWLKAAKPGAVQHVGQATVYPRGLRPFVQSDGTLGGGFPPAKVKAADLKPFILVETCAGNRVGRAANRKAAAKLIHDFHKSNPNYIFKGETL